MACKTKADAEKGEKKKEGVTLEAISTNYNEEFDRTDRSYVVFFVQRDAMVNLLHFIFRQDARFL